MTGKQVMHAERVVGYVNYAGACGIFLDRWAVTVLWTMPNADES